MEKWLVLGLGQVIHIYKGKLEDFVVPESKDMLKKKKDWACQKDTGANLKSSQWPKLKQFKQKIKI